LDKLASIDFPDEFEAVSDDSDDEPASKKRKLNQTATPSMPAPSSASSRRRSKASGKNFFHKYLPT
jgi:hypothetical protein